MIQNKNVKRWVDCWKSSMQEPDLITDEMQAVRWNKKAVHFAKDVNEERKQKKTVEFFELLDEAGFSPKDASVLDIGCGPGSLSVPLAQAGAEVTSLDISTGMLDRLRETAEHEGLHINPIECSWWTADIDKLGFRNKFDLVIASMTPAIKDVDTFDRMMACSNKYCYYSDYIRADPDKIPRDIYVRILEKAPQNNTHATGFLYPFMYLYILGFHPIVKINYKSVKRVQDCSEVAEKTIDFLQLTQALSDETGDRIREYYKNASINGRYNSDYEMYTGKMVWSVDKSNREDAGTLLQ